MTDDKFILNSETIWTKRFTIGSRILRYQLRKALLLTTVPMIVIIFLMVIMSVFVKLNIYYLEASGVPINDQIRYAYFDRVINEVLGASEYVGQLLASIFIVSFILMRWAISPFTRAERYIRKNVLNETSWSETKFANFSEFPEFDKIVHQFVTACRTNTVTKVETTIPKVPWNVRFFAKFFAAFTCLSLLSGKILASIFFLAYDRVVSLSLSLVPAQKLASHYFIAQQEILRDTVDFGVYTSILLYMILGRQISNYMANNIFIFARAISEQRFPIVLRKRDVYVGLADTLNKSFLKHRRGRI